MKRAWMCAAWVGSLTLLGCPGDDASTTGAGSTVGTSSTGDVTDTSDTTEPPATTDGSTTSTTDVAESSSGEPPAGTDSTGGGSTDNGCAPGTDGCVCDEGRCAGDLLCLEDTCQPAQCDGDDFELNEEESNAHDLGEINDNDDNGGVVSGSLHHDGDVDWYTYQGDDDITGIVDPTRELVASGGLRVCKFIECDAGLAETEIECPPGTDYALSPNSRPGCCSDGALEITEFNCSGVTEDSAAVYIRLDQPERACVTYSLAYHY